MKQTGLFDLSIPDYKKEADAAIKQVEEHADAEYLEEAYRRLLSLARRMKELTSNHLTTDMKSCPIKTHDARAIGPVMQRAVKAVILEKTGRYAPGIYGHGKPTPIWKSLIYEGEK